MSLFTTRVELHDAVAKDYETLHAEMAKDGFTRTIKLDTDKVSYHLPTAEYNYSHATKTTEEVMELAKTAAARTKKSFSVLVTKADGRRYWYNLPPVK